MRVTWAGAAEALRLGRGGQILLLALLLGMQLSLNGFAQIKSSTITGVVTDSTGAVIPGATVSVVNEETNVATGVTTDTSGSFTVPYLAPGSYRVLVEKSNGGF
ncbi:MAG: carboxypeptidase-like regulatory domain-containing protein [Acidobacteriota bacterium]